ncbi:SRPBCC family protein [Flavobacterium amniphilum]|uniref:SRPBCC family protein n=1 Tax=Flavobacterium amniphilum TaxID=1834035 RepID=UPI00202A952A|nr:SRPBCC family protein [Flavobacterium amniphilum]MCL9804351.1 SRPBCC family protein [Flavobacterium amniphilum]
MNEENHYALAEMLIRKPVGLVFEAFINPEITSKFWFTKGSGKLVEGEKVDWTWKMYNHTVTVFVKEISINKTIKVEWGNYDELSSVTWTFKEIDTDSTFVSVKNEGFKGDSDKVLSQVRDSTEGFTLVLAGLKAYLEHNIQLNLVGDRFPNP